MVIARRQQLAGEEKVKVMYINLTTLIMVTAILWMVVTLYSLHTQNKQANQLNDDLLVRIGELEDLITKTRFVAKEKVEKLEKLISQLHMGAEFSTDHMKTLEITIEAWRTSHIQFQSTEKYYQDALESARVKLAKCTQA